jgi:hypothetical protein
MMEHSDDLQENMQASMQAMSNIHTRKQMPNNMQVGVAEDQSGRKARAVEDRSGQEPMAQGSERQRTKSGRRSKSINQSMRDKAHHIHINAKLLHEHTREQT